MISFTVPAIPVAQPRQSQRVVHTKGGKSFATNYLPRSHQVNDYKASVRKAFKEAYSGPPLAGPICILLLFAMPRPKRLVWKNKPMPRCPHLTRPDCDNLQKSFCDALTGLAWNDDSQIFRLSISKLYASGNEAPNVNVTIYEESSEEVSSGPTRPAAVDT